MKKWFVLRKIVQVSAFALMLLPLLWASNPIWIGSYVASDFFGIPLTDPVAAIEVTLAGKNIWWPLVWSVLPLLLVAVIAGRVFCSWFCPLNTAIEVATFLKTSRKDDKVNNYLPYWILGACLVGSLVLSIPLFTLISPIGVLSRAIVFGFGLEIILIFMIIVAEWVVGSKTWCRRLCPIGALYGLLGRWRWVKVSIDPARCTQCGECHTNCTMRVTVGGNELLDQWNCTNCGDCVDTCAENAAQFSFKFGQKGGRTHHESMERITR